MFETNLRDVVSKAVKSLGVVRRVGKLRNCPRVLKSCSNAYVLLSLEYCAPVWMSPAKSHLGFLNSIVRTEEKLCEGDFCCLGHKMKVSALCLLYKIYHRVNHPMIEYLNHFVAARITRASASLGELALMIPRCRTNQFSQSFLHAAERLWNLLPAGVYSCGTLSSFSSAMNLCLLRTSLDYFVFLFQSRFAAL